MADASNVRHDTIVVPDTMSPAQVRALAERKAQAQVGDDDMVAFLHLHGSRSVGGEHGTEVEWRYSYQACRVGEHSAVVWNRVYWRPPEASFSKLGVWHGPPKALLAP